MNAGRGKTSAAMQAVRQKHGRRDAGLRTQALTVTRAPLVADRSQFHVGRLMVVQAKLLVNPPGDLYEIEADRVADRLAILRAGGKDDPAAANCSAPDPALRTTPLVQRQPLEDEPDDEGSSATEPDETLQEKSVGGVPDVGLETAERVASLRGSGAALPAQDRAFYEQNLSRDLSRVRIHTDAASTTALRARAYTVGSDVVFAPGEFSPHTLAGERLLAHELTHVVQQGAAPAGAIQREPRTEVPAPTALKTVRIYLAEKTIVATMEGGRTFTMTLDPARTNIGPGDYTATHKVGERRGRIAGLTDDVGWIFPGQADPSIPDWGTIPAGDYQLIVRGQWKDAPLDEGGATAEGAGKGKGTGEGLKGEGAGDKAGGDKGAQKDAGGGKAEGEKGGTPGGTGKPAGPVTAEDRKTLADFLEALKQAGIPAPGTPDEELITLLKDMSPGEREDLARFMRDAQEKTTTEGKQFDPKEVITFYKNLSPSDREILRTNLELSKSGASELPKKVTLALETSANANARMADVNSELAKQMGELARLRTKVDNPKLKDVDLDPIDLDQFPVFTEMMLLEGLLAGAAAKSPEIETIAKDLTNSIHGIRDYVMEEMAWLLGEMAATEIIAGLLAPVTAGISEAAATGRAVILLKKLNDLRKFLKKVEEIYSVITTIRSVILKVVAAYDAYKAFKAQYDLWSAKLERLQSLLNKANLDATVDGEDLDAEIEELEDEMIELLLKQLENQTGLGALLDSLFIPENVTEDELKEILFNIPRGIEAFRELITFYESVDRKKIEDIKVLAFKATRAGALLYPFVGFLAMTVSNKLSALMAEKSVSERLLGILMNAAEKAAKYKPPSKAATHAKLKKVKTSKAKKAEKGTGAGKKGKRGKKAEKANEAERDERAADKKKSEADKKDHEQKKAAGDRDDEASKADPKKTTDPKKPAADEARKSADKSADDEKRKAEDKKKEDEAKLDPKEQKKKEEADKAAKNDADWQIVKAKVAEIPAGFVGDGVAKDALLTAARKISKPYKVICNGPKITDIADRGFFLLTITRKDKPGTATAEVTMNVKNRWRKGQRAIESRIAGLPPDQNTKEGVEKVVLPLKEPYAYQSLRVGSRIDSQQGLGVFGRMGKVAERVITTTDDLTDLHFGTATDPIPVQWYKERGNYPGKIKLRLDGTLQDVEITSTKTLTVQKRGGPRRADRRQQQLFHHDG
jgi:Domain of unknown function (DUF4157)